LSFATTVTQKPIFIILAATKLGWVPFSFFNSLFNAHFCSTCLEMLYNNFAAFQQTEILINIRIASSLQNITFTTKNNDNSESVSILQLQLPVKYVD